MSDLNLARQYRPKNLREFLCTQTVRDQLMGLKNRKTPAKFIIISGNSGLGKTTLARILLKESRCHNKDTPEGTCETQGLKPEDMCPSCKRFNFYIETGDFSEIENLEEVDVGKYSRISDVRELLDEIELKSVTSMENKSLLLDEVHSLRWASQDALLKMLEEPEEDLTTIMCTNNIDKIQDTLINRAELVIKLQPPSVKSIARRFKEICEQEKIQYTQIGLELLATRFHDRIRNGVQALENVRDQYGEVSEKTVKEYLEKGEVPVTDYFKYLDGVLNESDKTKAIKVLHDTKINSDFETFAKGFTDFIRRGIYIRSGLRVDGVLDAEYDAYKKIISKLSVKQMSLLLDYVKNIRKGDIEINLLTLAYSSLGVLNTSPSVLPDLEVKEVQNEVRSEKKLREENLEEQRGIEDEKVKEEMDSLEETVSLEDLASGVLFQK